MANNVKAYMDLTRLHFFFVWPILFCAGLFLAFQYHNSFSWLLVGQAALIGFLGFEAGLVLNDIVDVPRYKHKRDLLAEGLRTAGYEFEMPEGTFYLFPKSPIPDDIAFVRALREENILTVPGSAFGGPGHFRIAYCVKDDTIKRSLPGFARTIEKFK